MGYLNGKTVFPKDLLAAIQEYIDGEYIYIPRKEANRREWGTSCNSKQYTLNRNQAIYQRYLSGVLAEALANEYCLSVKTIYGVVAKMKI